jgi:hypothetical protein
MPKLLSRLLAALPDAITACVFVAAWVAPQRIGPDRIGDLLTVLLIEFFVVHSSGFYAAILAIPESARRKRVFAFLGLAALYAIPMLGFLLTTKNPWPIYAFAWLLASRFAHLLFAPADKPEIVQRTVRLWVIAVPAYVLGAIATILLPLPALGVTQEVVNSLHLASSGEWSARPYKMLAFGTLYFSIQAWAKFALSIPRAPAARA